MHDLLEAPEAACRRFNSKPGHFALHRATCWPIRSRAAAVAGDPIGRDPERVARDVHNGLSRRTGPPRSMAWCCATARSMPKRRARAGARSAPTARRTRAQDGARRTAKRHGLRLPRYRRSQAFRCLCGADMGLRPKAGSHAPTPARCRRKRSGHASHCTTSWGCANFPAASVERCSKPRWRAAARNRSPPSCWRLKSPIFERAPVLKLPRRGRPSIFSTGSAPSGRRSRKPGARSESGLNPL